MNIAVTEGFGLQGSGSIFDTPLDDPFKKITVVAPSGLERPDSIRSICSAADAVQADNAAAPAYHRVRRTARAVERQAAVEAVDALGLPLAPLAVKRGAATINPDRLKHAQHIQKCPKISRYGADTFKSTFEVVYAPIPVQDVPEFKAPASQEQSIAVRKQAATSGTKASATPYPTAKLHHSTQSVRPNSPHTPQPNPTHSAGIRYTGTQLDMRAAQPVREAANPAQQHHTRVSDMFEQAIAEASHFIDIKVAQENKQRRVRRQRLMFAGGGVAAFLLLMLVFYVQTPGVQMRIAGMRAGVRSAVPDIGAAGLSYQGVHTQNDKRIITLTDAVGRRYSFSQQPTNWNEQEMIKHASPNSSISDIETHSAGLTAGGLRLYRIGDKAVMWVKDGTWYQFVGNEALSDAQLKELARGS